MALSAVNNAAHPQGSPTARDLCLFTPDVSPDTDNITVLKLFNTHKHLTSLPVVEDGRPFGLINRHIFLSQMARPFFHELYDKKSCIAFMDKNPLIVDADATLGEVAGKTVVSGDKTLTDGFIICENGRYLGIGSGIDLIKAVADIHVRQHQQIMQSIEYASVIQASMLSPSRHAMANELTDWCLQWQPRDCVGGDSYYFKSVDQGWLCALADCTGHGVPGAFMTLIFASALEQAIALHGATSPAHLLPCINQHIKDTLGQSGDGQLRQKSRSNDGCDAIIVFVDRRAQSLTWASARMPAFILTPESDQIIALENDRMGIGYSETPYDYRWPSFTRPLHERDLFFTSTDGLTDQIGGKRHIMYGRQRLKDALLRHQSHPMQELARQLLREHADYQGQQTRRDDLTFWGFRYAQQCV
ncbi:SpoIIE family protein phosphatase [Affinibrenneria salicis]|uniref:SpoIIE family protein phosphatase n=2 Tax=Affinibrenneria salicis TaxID=2590031 RepID=A0A5J5FT37_9GAMM|nr:SpoIIE family protein phosphatase [Affinibrenneria salicis]KAA8996213.1 SpoIIE family protein phosphatase [Affinibrenneria salicis]